MFIKTPLLILIALGAIMLAACDASKDTADAPTEAAESAADVTTEAAEDAADVTKETIE
jgi:hypothetical protein